MAKKKERALVVSQEKIAENIYDLKLKTDIAKMAKCGQFVGVYTKNSKNLLPRPISLCEIDRDENILRLVYRVVGEGTSEFKNLRDGDFVDIMGSLGNGYPIEEARDRKVILIGGGIGVPPILQTSKELKGIAKEINIVMGYRNSEIFLSKEFEKNGKLFIATDDGSVGTHGTVIDALKENNIEGDIIYACGPMPMLRGLKAYAKENNIKAYISLEEKMACGVGACLGCIVKTKNIDSHSHVNNARICTDGPVFDAEDVNI